MKFTLTMNMDNAAFTDGGCSEDEVVRLLHELAGYVSDSCLAPGTDFILMDINGNRVGNAEVTE